MDAGLCRLRSREGIGNPSFRRGGLGKSVLYTGLSRLGMSKQVRDTR